MCDAMEQRNKQQRERDALLQMSEMMGLVTVKRQEKTTQARQLTLDIRSRTRHGMPIKGSKARKATQAEIDLAKEIVLNRFMVIGNGDLAAKLP